MLMQTPVQAKERARLKKVIAKHDKAQSQDAVSDDRVWRSNLAATRKSARKSGAEALLRQDGMKAAKKAFDAALAKASAQAEAQGLKQRKAAAAASRKRTAQRNAMLANRLKSYQAIGPLGVLGASDGPRYLLQTPFEISITGAPLTEHRIVTGASFARFKFNAGSGKQATPRLHFSYVWQNPTDRYVLINAHGYVIFDGYLQLGVGGGFWPGDRYAKIQADAAMSLHDWTGEPALPSAYTLTRTAALLSERDDGFWAVGAVAAADVFRGFDLDTSLYIVKPHGTIGLVIAATFPYATGSDSGSVLADFADGAHRVSSPGILIQVVS